MAKKLKSLLECNIDFNIWQDNTFYINLNKSPELLLQVQNGDINAQQVAFMTHQEMQPEKWDTIIQEKIKRDKYKFESSK